MGSCEVGEGAMTPNGGGFPVGGVGTLLGPGSFAVESTRPSPGFDGIVGEAGGAVALVFRPAGCSPSAKRILRDLEIVGFEAFDAAAVFRATFCAGATGLSSAFVLTRFLTRTVRSPALLNRR